MDHTQFRGHSPQAPDVQARHLSYPVGRAVVTATVAGLVLGPLDLLAQTTLPYPWANLGNSGAVWALAAFVQGATLRSAAASAAAGIALLPLAVESYYLAGVIFRHDSTSTLWSSTTGLWLVLAVIVGPLFGLVGAASHSPRRAARFAAVAFIGSIFLLEAFAILARSRGDGGSNHAGQTAVIEIVLALAVPLLTLALTRHRA